MDDGIAINVVCFYCTQYNRIYEDYPINPGIHNDFHDLTPRCELHFQYECDTCHSKLHFNGIGFCQDCNRFTCVKCSPPKLIFEYFFYYDCYYTVECNACKQVKPCLDYAEYTLSHPYQIGARIPHTPIALWVPIEKPDTSLVGSKFGWGSKRIIALAPIKDYKRLDHMNSLDAKEIWDNNADYWKQSYGKDGDYHHKNTLIPNMVEMASQIEKKPTSVLDVGCGYGKLCRYFAENGCQVAGIDLSEGMLWYAKEEERKNPLGITYSQGDATKLDTYYEKNSRDLVISNMAVMDMPHHNEVFKQVYDILQPNGYFIFSISHPVFAWPPAYTVKLPHDSQRSEDKIWVIDNYFEDRATKIDLPDIFGGILNYPRTLSKYINSLITTGFTIKEVREPQPSEELVKKLPREAFRDDDRVPQFMIFKVQKL